MKFLSQFISLYLPEANSLQVVAATGSAITFFKMATSRLFGKHTFQPCGKNTETEDSMWQIE